jgi:hypothetical protein
MHSLVAPRRRRPAGAPGDPLNDGRSHAEVEELAGLGIDLQRRTGVLPMPGFTGPEAAVARAERA